MTWVTRKREDTTWVTCGSSFGKAMRVIRPCTKVCESTVQHGQSNQRSPRMKVIREGCESTVHPGPSSQRLPKKKVLRVRALHHLLRNLRVSQSLARLSFATTHIQQFLSWLEVYISASHQALGQMGLNLEDSHKVFGPMDLNLKPPIRSLGQMGFAITLCDCNVVVAITPQCLQI